MGEYDRVKPKSAVSERVDDSSPRTSPSLTKPSLRSRQIVRAPIEWLILGSVMLVVSFLPILISRSSISYLATFGVAITATLFAVLSLLEDQRRMRAPAYSLNRNFRKFGAALYGVSTLVVLSVIVMVGLRAATQ